MDRHGEKKMLLGSNGKEEEDALTEALPLAFATPLGTAEEDTEELVKIAERKLDGASTEEPSKFKQLVKQVDLWYDGDLKKKGYVKKFVKFLAGETKITLERIEALLAVHGVTEEYCKEVVTEFYPTETQKVFAVIQSHKNDKEKKDESLRAKDEEISHLQQQLAELEKKKTNDVAMKALQRIGAEVAAVMQEMGADPPTSPGDAAAGLLAAVSAEEEGTEGAADGEEMSEADWKNWHLGLVEYSKTLESRKQKLDDQEVLLRKDFPEGMEIMPVQDAFFRTLLAKLRRGEPVQIESNSCAFYSFLNAARIHLNFVDGNKETKNVIAKIVQDKVLKKTFEIGFMVEQLTEGAKLVLLIDHLFDKLLDAGCLPLVLITLMLDARAIYHSSSGTWAGVSAGFTNSRMRDFVSSEDFLAFIRNENEEEWSLDQFVNAFCDGAGTPLGGTNDEGEHEG